MVKGFTLIELIVTLAISSIVLLSSGGFYGKFVERQKVTADISKIISAISSARGHAISQRENIHLCGIQAEQCSRQWKVLSVFNANKDLLYRDTLSANYSQVLWSAFQRKSQLEFKPNGFTNHQNGTLYLCHKHYPTLNRAIIISKSGRVRTSQSVDNQCL